MSCRGDIVPILLAVLLPLFCVITYGIAVGLGHVNANFPYISDTGTYPPESCIFGVLLGLYAFLSAFGIYIRYLQITDHYLDNGKRTLVRVNIAGMIFGLISSFGLFLVANFQTTNQPIVHVTGATFAFGGSDVYFWIQTVISYKMRHVPGYRGWLGHFRLLLSILHAFCCIGGVVCAIIAYSQLMNNYKQKGHWDDQDGGFSWHVGSTSLEWTVIMLSCIYFLSFMREFRRFRFTLPQITFTNTIQINPTTEQRNEHFSNNLAP